MTPSDGTNSKTPKKKNLLVTIKGKTFKKIVVQFMVFQNSEPLLFSSNTHINFHEKSINYIQDCFRKGSLIKTHFYLKKVIIKRRLCRCWITTSKRRLRIISEQCNDGIICYTRRHDQKEKLIIKRQPEKQWFENRALKNTC